MMKIYLFFYFYFPERDQIDLNGSA